MWSNVRPLPGLLESRPWELGRKPISMRLLRHKKHLSNLSLGSRSTTLITEYHRRTRSQLSCSRRKIGSGCALPFKPFSISKISNVIFYSKPERAAVHPRDVREPKTPRFLLGFLGLWFWPHDWMFLI